MMINPQKAEAMIKIDDQDYLLRLTLGALAEIESELGCSDFSGLSQRLKRFDAQSLCVILAAMLRAGGAEHADIVACQADPSIAANTVGQVFETSFS